MARKYLILVCVALISLNACKKSGCTNVEADNYDSTAKKEDGTCVFSDPNAELKGDIKRNYVAMVKANYADALSEAKRMQTKIQAFINTPTEGSLIEAKDAWRAAREPYGVSEAYRFSNGPVDNEVNGVEGLLNAWPLDEAHIDYVASGTGNDDGNVANLINDANFVITKAAIEGMNENPGEKNISAGYHAVEFLLWGQDLNGVNGDEYVLNVIEGGKRPVSDYTTEVNAERRKSYLREVTSLLVDHLIYLNNEWTKSNGYADQFLAEDDRTSLGNMLNAVGELSRAELAGERMIVALNAKDQEDEHSCFSDNTHRDIWLNALGCKNVFNGSYTRVDGTKIEGASLADLTEALAPELNDKIQTIFSKVEMNLSKMPIPFDYAIHNEVLNIDAPGPILQAYLHLIDEGNTVAEIANKLDLPIQLTTDEDLSKPE